MGFQSLVDAMSSVEKRMTPLCPVVEYCSRSPIHCKCEVKILEMQVINEPETDAVTDMPVAPDKVLSPRSIRLRSKMSQWRWR